MERIVKLLYLCLLAASLCEYSTGFFSSRRRRKCSIWRRRCRQPPPIPVLPVTIKPKKATTPRPVVVLNPVKPHSSGLPFCKSRDVNAILNLAGRRTKRAVSWPYECRYASIVLFSGNYQFIWPIYDCCSKCSFPAFTTCVADSQNKASPEWRCPSEGLHCIVGCVNKHNPAKTISTAGLVRPILPSVVKSGIRPVSGKIKPVKPVKPALIKCEKLDRENGKQCIRKLCVPLNFKPR